MDRERMVSGMARAVEGGSGGCVLASKRALILGSAHKGTRVGGRSRKKRWGESAGLGEEEMSRWGTCIGAGQARSALEPMGNRLCLKKQPWGSRMGIGGKQAPTGLGKVTWLGREKESGGE